MSASAGRCVSGAVADNMWECRWLHQQPFLVPSPTLRGDAHSAWRLWANAMTDDDDILAEFQNRKSKRSTTVIKENAGIVKGIHIPLNPHVPVGIFWKKDLPLYFKGVIY